MSVLEDGGEKHKLTTGAIEVRARTRSEIREIAWQVRRALGATLPYLDIVRLVEMVLPIVLPDLVFSVQSKAEMGDHHGLTVPDHETVLIREDVYERACEGCGRDRFTVAHELGHLVLHRDIQVQLARGAPFSIRKERNSEWQADVFAGELLVSAEYLAGCSSDADLVEKFGVSRGAARAQWRVFSKEGLVNIKGA